jgi:hypothetical protein
VCEFSCADLPDFTAGATLYIEKVFEFKSLSESSRSDEA